MKLSRRLIPDVTTLQAFECAARHGSFTQAAHELNLTQSAVSRQIKDLEEQLGVLLFERVRQRINLTEAGEAYLKSVRAALEIMEAATMEALAFQSGGGVLNIATLPTFGTRWLAPRLGRFRALHPDLRVELDLSPDLRDLAGGGYDIAIRNGHGSWPGLNAVPLFPSLFTPLCAPRLADAVRGLDDPAIQLRVPLLGTYHTDFPAYVDNLTGDHRIVLGATEYMKWLYGQMAGVFARSRAYHFNLQRIGVADGRLRDILPGIDTDKFNPRHRDVNLWAERGVTEPHRLLYVGRVSVEKNLPLLVEAFKRLCQVRRDAARGCELALDALRDQHPLVRAHRREPDVRARRAERTRDRCSGCRLDADHERLAAGERACGFVHSARW